MGFVGQAGRLGLTILLCFVAFFVQAQEEIELDKIVVSADLFPRNIRKVGQSVSVITAKDIQEKNRLTVGEVFQSLPGVSVVSLGAPGDDLDIRIRGSDRDEVLVLLDGLPINNLTDNRANILNSIPVDLIEKVELIRGAQSVIYGSSAVGGVINVITKKGSEKPKRIFSVQAGNLGTFKETMMATGKSQSKKSSYGLSFSRHDQKGRFANDRFGANNFFANYGFEFSDRFRLRANLFFTDQKQELAFGSATSLANLPRIDLYVIRDLDRFIRRDILVPQFALEWDVASFYKAKLSYGLYYEDQSVQNSNQNDVQPADPFAALDSQDFNSRSHRHNFDFRNIFQIVDQSDFSIDIVAGVAGQLEYLSFSDNPFAGDTTAKTASRFPGAGQEGDRRNISGYGQLSFSWLDRVSLSAGFRYDDNDTFGQAFSPRVSASYFYSKSKTKFFTSYSQGFIAPTLNQYYLAVIGGTLTQRLDKESSHTFEVGFVQEAIKLGKTTSLSFGSTFFHTDYNTYINELQLVNNAHVTGVESFFKFSPVKWLETNANYTYMQAINDDDGSSLSNRPRHQFHGDVRVFPIKHLSFVFEAEAMSGRLNSNVLSAQGLGNLQVATFDSNNVRAGNQLPSFFVFNAYAQYKQMIDKDWMQEIRYSFRVNNILNKNYQLKYGYPMPRLNFLGGIDVVF